MAPITRGLPNVVIGKMYVHVYSAAPAAIFACIFMETLFTMAATANRTMMTSSYTNEK